MVTKTNNLLCRAALFYASQIGWLVFPLKPSGKQPITSHGVKDATRERKIIREWWTQSPDANIGLPTGRVTNLIVVDVDGTEGEQSCEKLC